MTSSVTKKKTSKRTPKKTVDEPRETVTPPKVKVINAISKAVLDIVGLVAVVYLSETQAWPKEVSSIVILSILGLMRFAPIAKKGGPLGFLLAAAAGAASSMGKGA